MFEGNGKRAVLSDQKGRKMEILYEMPGFLFEDSYSHQWVRLSMLWEQVSLVVLVSVKKQDQMF